MIVGSLRVRLLVRESRSLKDKRQVVQSVKDRLRNSFNVSVSEVEEQEHRQLAVLGIAMVSNEAAHVRGTFDQILQALRSHPVADVTGVLEDFEAIAHPELDRVRAGVDRHSRLRLVRRGRSDQGETAQGQDEQEQSYAHRLSFLRLTVCRLEEHAHAGRGRCLLIVGIHLISAASPQLFRSLKAGGKRLRGSWVL